ncbi:hypothetical protein CYMTET_40387 [Cymbomonas tetramitiformis]|uniref:Uncharacterized protein n=1 Tax=Cymbomonas tetramitiformis TaxID=36881 RepID=A0AAE0C9E8_9CHLO|nr:hypothetical protein CYMTET_40387 [Cymbomonas tetramitiformis]
MSPADLAKLRERVELVKDKEAKIADISLIFEYIQDATGLQLVDVRTKQWEPFERSGWKGWLVVAAVALVPLLTFIVLWRDFSAAGTNLAKLL